MKHELYRATGLPVLQNRTFADAQAARASASADMRLVQDGRTGLVYNDAFDPSTLSYDSDYQNEQAHSARFQRHLDDVEGVIARHFKGQRLIEVGCGKGWFLELMRERGYTITGIDPAYEGDNPDVVKAPFSRELNRQADAIVLRHVLEHIQDPLAFLAAIADANGGAGQIYIEVPCLDWIIEHKAWFDLFYEHVNYFRLADLHRLFGTVVEAGHLFDGQYLYIVADLASLRSVLEPVPPLTLPADFSASLEHAVRLVQRDAGRGSAIWGASSKGVIYSLFLQRAGAAVDWVIDINPAKQGRYLPLSGVRVASPQQALQHLPDGAQLFVMNSNYLEEIRRMTDGRFTYHAVDSVAFTEQSTEQTTMTDTPIKAFEAECSAQIAAQGEDKELRQLSRDFFNKSAEHKYSYHFSWMGRPIIQLPQDMMAMQEIVWQVKPDLIIECGIAHGGSILYYASLLELQGHGEVLGIDIDIRPHNREAIEAHPMSKRVRMIEGSSIDADIASQVRALAEGKRVILVLDSNHTHEHVLKELELYAPLVAVGSYCVVMDTVVEDMPADFFPDRPWGPGDNPKTAVWEYLKGNDNFEIDYQLQNKLLVTVAPDGYLRRVR